MKIRKIKEGRHTDSLASWYQIYVEFVDGTRVHALTAKAWRRGKAVKMLRRALKAYGLESPL
ncbi:MAG: hypothetical protein ACK53T_00245 [Planctomycetota bacterium]